MNIGKKNRSIVFIIFLLIIFQASWPVNFAEAKGMRKGEDKKREIYTYQLADFKINDTYRKNLWGVQRINASSAWKITKGSSSVIVAVIDTGIDYNHEDLMENIWINEKEIPENGIDDDANGYVDDYLGWDFFAGKNDPMDDNGHGTGMAGAIAAVGNNKRGIAGVAWKTKIMALKTFSVNGGGSSDKLAAAVKYAADNGAKIINASWTSKITADPILESAIDYAYAKGVLIVVAAGNGNEDANLYAPANMKNVLAVGSVDKKDKKAGFSNWGEKVNITAPGVGIKTTGKNNEYQTASGTSISTAYVSAAAALLFSYDSGISSEEIKGIFQKTAQKTKNSKGKYNPGAGRLDVLRALKYAAKKRVSKL